MSAKYSTISKSHPSYSAIERIALEADKGTFVSQFVGMKNPHAQMAVLNTVREILTEANGFQWSEYLIGILRSQDSKMEQFGSGAYPMSENQIRCFFSEVANARWEA